MSVTERIKDDVTKLDERVALLEKAVVDTHSLLENIRTALNNHSDVSEKNVAIVMQLAVVANICCERLGIKNEEIIDVIEKENQRRAAEITLQSERAGTDGSDTGSGDTTVLPTPSKGAVSPDSNPEASNGEHDSGDQPASVG